MKHNLENRPKLADINVTLDFLPRCQKYIIQLNEHLESMEKELRQRKQKDKAKIEKNKSAYPKASKVWQIMLDRNDAFLHGSINKANEVLGDIPHVGSNPATKGENKQ